MTPWYEDSDKLRMVLELFRCHYKASEVSRIVNIEYTVIASMFKAYRNDKIIKYDRRNLSEWEGIYNEFTEDTKHTEHTEHTEQYAKAS